MTSHRSSQITKPGYIRIPATCVRCGGDGIWKGWNRGTCFRCGGTGHEPNGERIYAYPSDWTDEQISAHEANRAAKRDAAAQRKEDKRTAALNAFLSTSPVLPFYLDYKAFPESYGSFVHDVFYKLQHYGSISERQAEAVVSAAERDLTFAGNKAAREAEQAAAARPVPTGTVTIEGDVVSVKSQENRFGSTLKMLVACDGFKVWGTVPSSFGYESPKGQRVRFTASVEASDDDPSFGFFKRPRNAEILSVQGVDATREIA